VGRALTLEERRRRYLQATAGDTPPRDFLSIIKFNSTYMELVDRWYPIAGFSVWVGFALVFGGLLGATVSVAGFFVAPASSEQSALWFSLLILAPRNLGVVAAGWFVIRTESWRWTHYPMRLNRKTRQVHVF